MSDAHETLSYVISADDKASGVIRNIGSELEGLTNKGVLGLRNLDSAWSGLASKKPLTLVKAEQAAQLAQVEAAQAKLNKTMAGSGVATKLNAAEYDLLTQKHKALQKEIDKTAESHKGLSKVATVASAGVLTAILGVAAGAVKQGIAWEDLGKTIQQETGLSGKSLSNLMGTINNVTGTVPYKLGEVSAAAVLLNQKFHETNPEIEKQAGLMAGFAKRANEEVKPAVTGLLSIMQDYRRLGLEPVTNLTDKLAAVAQTTQKPMGELLTVVERYGPKLQAMGFGLNESIKLLGIFQESGISTSMMGRGLSQAVTIADKTLGVTAANPHGTPQEALEKEALALKKVQDAVDKINETIPKTVAQQNQLGRQREVAVDALGKEQTKYESLKKAIEQNGGAHATVASIIKSEIVQIQHAKTEQEAFSVATADFGKQVGPSFARAFYHNEAAIKAIDVALGKHGATLGLVKAEEATLEGQVTKIDEQWHKTERTLSVELLPAVGEFLKLIGGGVTDIEKFTKGNASLAEALGAVATVGAGAFLARKPIKAVVGGAESIFQKLTGIGGGGTPGVGSISGVRGTTLPGSLTNPIYVRPDGTVGPSGTSKVEEDAKKAAEDAKGSVVKDAEHTGEGAAGTGLLSKIVSLAKGPLAGGGADVAETSLTLDAAAAATTAAAALAIPAVGLAAMKIVSPETFAAHSQAEFSGLKGLGAGEFPVGPTGHGHETAGALGEPKAGFDAAGTYIGAQQVKQIENTQAQVEANKLLLTSSTEIKQSEEELASMRQQGETHTKQYAETLKSLKTSEEEHAKGLADLAAAEGKHAATMRSEVEGSLNATDSALKSHPSAATISGVLGNYQTLTAGIKSEIGAANTAVGQGVDAINKQLLSEVKALNGGKVASLAEGGAPLAPGVEKALSGHAMGGRVPGAVGPDNWTLVDPSGRAAAKVGGSELLIGNRHTEARVDRMLAPYGTTLGREVAGETTPHSAAYGGRFVADPGTNFTYGKEPQITADLQKLAEQQGWTIYGISGYRSPQHSIEVGGFANDPHTRGEAADVGINSQELASAAALNAAMLAAVGLERPFYPASPHEINHVQLLGSGAVGGARGAVTEAVAAAQTAMQKLKTPQWGGPGGMLGSIGSAALAQVTRAANARLAGVAGTAGAGLGALTGFHGGGTPSANEELGKKMMVAAGWSPGEWPDLQALWTEESGWSATALNSASGAFGIPQSLPASKMASAGGDWRTNPATQIAWGLKYIKERYGSPSGAEAHEKAFNWYEKGGRVDYAGAFGHGGSVTASKPTLAMFGDKGPETAHFVPHAATGTRVGGSGLAETQGVNPDTGEIEYHTQEEWQQIRLQHSSQAKKEALYKKAHPKAKMTYEDPVNVGGLAAGVVSMPTTGSINLPGDISKLSASVWAKVVAAIEKTLKATSDDRVAVGITGQLSREHGSRAQALTSKAIGASASTVLRNLKALPEETGVAAGGPAVASLDKLIADAKRSGNEVMVGALRKDVETALKTTTSRVMKAAESAPAFRAAGADEQALSKLQSLADQARRQGTHILEQSIFKDIGKTVTNMMSSVSGKLTKSKAATAAPEALKIAQANLAKEAGTAAATSATDGSYLKQEEANENQAIKEMTAARAAVEKLEATERTQIKALIAKEHKLRDQQHKLLAKLHAKEKTAREHHHKAEVAAIQASIKRVQAQLGETQTQLSETSTQLGESEAQTAEVSTAITEEGINVVDLQQEYKEAVHDAFKKGIEEAAKALDDQAGRMGTELQITEAQETIAGHDVSQLGKLKTEQEGVLTPTQQRQANEDLQAYISNANQQMGVLGQERSGEEEALGNPLLSASDRTELQDQIAELTLKIVQLQAGIVTQTESTKELTKATEANTKTYGGTVGFEYQGQQYAVGGQSSNSASDINVGM